jgi:mRNA-degrading endonuclease YafQ of YafQ-DinJ toxin-antitoxin module
VLDDSNFPKLVEQVNENADNVKIEYNPNTNKLAFFKLKAKGKSSYTTQERRITEVTRAIKQTFETYNSEHKEVDLTDQYKGLLECHTAVNEYRISLKRIASYYKGYGIIGESRYVEFFKTNLSLPTGQDLNILDASSCPSYINYEQAKFVHISIEGRDYLVIKDDLYKVFYRKDLQPKTDLTKIVNTIEALLSNKSEPSWIVDHNLHTDIRRASVDMHLLSTAVKQSDKVNSTEYVLNSINIVSMTSKNSITIEIEENHPKVPISLSTLCMFKNSINQDERLVFYTFKNGLSQGKDINLIEFQKDSNFEKKPRGRSAKTPNQEEEKEPNWVVIRYALVV